MSDINWGLIRSGSTFEDLICALIRLEDHEARLYVRPGKDFAQDARSGDGLTIYQMKFHQNESTSSAIRDAKDEAKKKIARYQSTPGPAQEVWRGVKKWILISNVAFNPTDELKWNTEVKPEFDKLGLIATYWEKSVIETKLLKYPDLKQAYFGGETRVFLGIAEAREQVRLQEFSHPYALDACYQDREKELEQYKNFLLNDSKKILVIHGAGGIGKTRFLLEGAKTQALPDGWQVLWANVASMMTNTSWFMGLIPELPTLLLIDDPDDVEVLKMLVEQISGGRAKTWKVAIAVRSPNDPVLKYLQEKRTSQIVEELPLEPLKESAAIAFCQELLKFGVLQAQTADWQKESATWIAQHYDRYPLWMAIAVKLLESKSNLETMPQEADGLASEYLEEILTQQQNIPREQVLNLLRWTALFNTVNREDTAVIDWIRAKIGCRNPTELQRYFDSLITRKVIFERGAGNRLLKIKPDVLADYILRNWLTYSKPSEINLKASSEALEIVEEARIKIDSGEASSIQKLLLIVLKRIARFELIYQLSKKPINLLGRLLSDWSERVPRMNALQKLGYLSILDEISFAHVSEVLSLLRKVLSSTSEAKTVSTIFGERIITHDDVILALPRIIYHTALCAQTDTEERTILSLLCELVIAERDIATRRPQGLPNDGNRAGTVLPRVITGGPEFRRNFGKSAFEEAKKLLIDICSQENISEEQKLHLDALVKPLLCIEQENTLFDGRFIRAYTWFITPDRPEWEIRDLLRQTIKDILLSQKIQPAQAVFLWNLLAYAHREINQVLREFSQQQSVAPSYYEVFRTAIVQDLQWVRDFLNSHRLDIQELTAARKIWDWHYKFDKYPELKEIATQCETLFEQSELFTQYAPLLRWESYEALGQWATEKSHQLNALNNTQSIQDFVKNGVKFLGNSDQASRLFIVAEKLGSEPQKSQAVGDFVEEALKLNIKDSEFQFAITLSRSWVWATWHNNPLATIALLEQLLQWTNTSEKIVQLIQAIYESAWSINITEPEVDIVLAQQEHFLQANSAVRFVGLLGSIFFSSSEKIKNTVETTLNELDCKQLSSALPAFLQSLNYAIHSRKNTEEVIDPSLRNWILDQVLRLPNIDDLGGTASEYLEEILKMLGQPDLEWLISAIERRIQMFSQSDGSNIRILPSQNRVSQWITHISPDQADDTTIRSLIAKLLSYADSYPSLGYNFPQYLIDVDPTGVITAGLVVEKLKDPKVRGNPRETWQWAKFAGYYPDDSTAWRKIAYEACSLAVQFDDRDKYSIFQALTYPGPKTRISNIGEVSPTFEKAVETAQQRLEDETEPALIPFREWILQSAEAELSSEIERVKEEIDE